MILRYNMHSISISSEAYLKSWSTLCDVTRIQRNNTSASRMKTCLSTMYSLNIQYSRRRRVKKFVNNMRVIIKFYCPWGVSNIIKYDLPTNGFSSSFMRIFAFSQIIRNSYIIALLFQITQAYLFECGNPGIIYVSWHKVGYIFNKISHTRTL